MTFPRFSPDVRDVPRSVGDGPAAAASPLVRFLCSACLRRFDHGGEHGVAAAHPLVDDMGESGGPRDRDDDEPCAHLFGLRAAFLTAADDITLEDIARSIKICRAEMGRRGLS